MCDEHFEEDLANYMRFPPLRGVSSPRPRSGPESSSCCRARLTRRPSRSRTLT